MLYHNEWFLQLLYFCKMHLREHFTEASDFRVKGHCLHELSNILLILLLGTLADCGDFSEIEVGLTHLVEFANREAVICW